MALASQGGKTTRERRKGQHVKSIVYRGPVAMAKKPRKKAMKVIPQGGHQIRPGGQGQE
jgi:hypothetical protein